MLMMLIMVIIVVIRAIIVIIKALVADKAVSKAADKIIVSNDK